MSVTSLASVLPSDGFRKQSKPEGGDRHASMMAAAKKIGEWRVQRQKSIRPIYTLSSQIRASPFVTSSGSGKEDVRVMNPASQEPDLRLVPKVSHGQLSLVSRVLFPPHWLLY